MVTSVPVSLVGTHEKRALLFRTALLTIKAKQNHCEAEAASL